MKYRILFYILLSSYCCYSQPATSSQTVDSAALGSQLHYIDSIKNRQNEKAVFIVDTIIYKSHPYFHFTKPVRFIVTEKQWQGREAIFYSVVGVLLFFAFIRNSFSRYLQDVFRLFFRTTLRQRQIKEQLAQTPFPSLLLNSLFIFSGGLFTTLLLLNLRLKAVFSFWQLFLYAVVALAGIYLVKFIILKVLGWIFRLSEVMEGYIFVVFTTNKIIGVVLLPFLVLLGFTSGVVYKSILPLSLIVIGGLFIYRFYLSYAAVHKQIKINILHFILYLAAFEIAPLLLINKLLLKVIG